MSFGHSVAYLTWIQISNFSPTTNLFIIFHFENTKITLKNSVQDLTSSSDSNSHTALSSDCLVKINHYQQQKQHRWQKRGLNWLLLSCRQSLCWARATQRFPLPGIPWVETVRFEISLISRVGHGHSEANKNFTSKWLFFPLVISTHVSQQVLPV